MDSRVFAGGGRIAALAFVAVLVAGFAYVRTPAQGSVISACFNMQSGLIRVSDGTCRPGEAPLNLAEGGLATCPAGTFLIAGVCMDEVARDADDHIDARRACADEGRRLPLVGEISAAVRGSDAEIEDAEWTDDLADITDSFRYAWAGTNGNGAVLGSNLLPFRCVG